MDLERQARALVALNVLIGHPSARLDPMLDPEETEVIRSFREVRSWGWAKMFLSVADGELQLVETTRTRKKKDFLKSP